MPFSACQKFLTKWHIKSDDKKSSDFYLDIYMRKNLKIVYFEQTNFILRLDIVDLNSCSDKFSGMVAHD